MIYLYLGLITINAEVGYMKRGESLCKPDR